MTKRKAKRRAHELAAHILRGAIDAGAEFSEDEEEYLLIEQAMRAIIDRLLSQAHVDYEFRWGV